MIRSRTSVRVFFDARESAAAGRRDEVSVEGGQSGAVLTLKRGEALDLLEKLAGHLGYTVIARSRT